MAHQEMKVGCRRFIDSMLASIPNFGLQRRRYTDLAQSYHLLSRADIWRGDSFEATLFMLGWLRVLAVVAQILFDSRG